MTEYGKGTFELPVTINPGVVDCPLISLCYSCRLTAFLFLGNVSTLSL